MKEQERYTFHLCGCKNYRKKHVQPMRPWEDGENMSGVSISDADKTKGCPKQGDMIAINPNNISDRWLIEKEFFETTYEPA
jgi:hypothetical protein